MPIPTSLLRFNATGNFIAGLLLLGSASSPAIAQCDGTWNPQASVPGVIGEVYSMTEWDPDGAGPGPTGLVICGKFEGAGDVVSRNIAAWFPTLGEWRALATDDFFADSYLVADVLGLPDGRLVAVKTPIEFDHTVGILSDGHWAELNPTTGSGRLGGGVSGLDLLATG